MPAANVEPEAKDRLGLEAEANGRFIEAAIALRYPHEIGEGAQPFRRPVRSPLFILRLHRKTAASAASQSPAGWTAQLRTWPTWSALVSVPQHAVDRATTTLQEGIDGAAKLLGRTGPDPSRASQWQ